MTQFFQSISEVFPLSALVQLPIAGFLAFQVWCFHAAQARSDERLKTIERTIVSLRDHRHRENNHAQVQETRVSLLEYRASKESK